jgi:formamidopyrimidine-DNA glycosylase
MIPLLTRHSDEVLYNAKLHPEQYSDTFSTEQLEQLYKSITYVCQTAVDALGDSSQFPEDWLFNHRWGKGKKDAPTILPTGEKITFLKVGGRTSCVVPSVQKKTGAVAGDLKTEEKMDVFPDEEDEPEGRSSKRRKVVKEEDHMAAENKSVIPKKRRAAKEQVTEGVEAKSVMPKKRKAVKEEDAENVEVEPAIPKKRKAVKGRR